MERILMTATSIEPEDEPYVNEALKLIGARGRVRRAEKMNPVIYMEMNPDRLKDAFHRKVSQLRKEAQGAKVIPIHFNVLSQPKRLA